MKVTVTCPGFTLTEFAEANGTKEIMDEAPRRFFQTPEAVVPAVQNALQLAFGDDRATAVLLSQKLIGRKVWVK